MSSATDNIQDRKKLPLKRTNGKTVPKWKDFSGDPIRLFDYLLKYFYVDLSIIDKTGVIYLSASDPGAEHSDKIWVNPQEGFLAYYNDGTWNKIYKYPKKQVIFWTKTEGELLNEGLRKLTEDEIESLGLSSLTSGKVILAIHE